MKKESKRPERISLYASRTTKLRLDMMATELKISRVDVMEKLINNAFVQMVDGFSNETKQMAQMNITDLLK